VILCCVLPFSITAAIGFSFFGHLFEPNWGVRRTTINVKIRSVTFKWSNEWGKKENKNKSINLKPGN